jgi:outer membrane protein TolC
VNEADPQNVPNPLTLAESVSIALSNSSIIKAAQRRLDQASPLYVQLRSALLPQIDVFAGQSYPSAR